LGIYTSLLVATLLFFTRLVAAPPPSPVGIWRTIDDITNKPRGLIRLYEQEGKLFGKIEASFDMFEAKEICDRCEGDRRNRPVIGLIVVRNMKKSGTNEYTGGDILDPDTGQVYKCRITLDDNGRRLIVRGYIGIALLGRSQVWFRQN